MTNEDCSDAVCKLGGSYNAGGLRILDGGFDIYRVEAHQLHGGR